MISKERILEKTEDLFIQHGIKRITMDDIATHIGISKKTIYQYFTDKNELVSEIFDKHLSLSRCNYTADVEKSENAIHEMLLGSETFCSIMQSMNRHVLFDLEKYHPDIFKRFIEYKNNFLHQIIYLNLERGIREGLYRADLNLEVITRLRLQNILLPMNGDIYPAHQFAFRTVEHELVTHYLNGIVTPKGAAVVKQYNESKDARQPMLN